MNVCVVGCGAICETHLNVLKNSEYATVYAVCDIIKEKADKMAQKYGAKAFYTYEDCLLDSKIEAVHICTPHYLHYDMIVKALDCGKKVVCEKPLVMKKEELEPIMARKDKNMICPVFQNRYNAPIAKFKEIAESGNMGKIIGARAFVTWWRDADYYNSATWRGKWATEGGGVLINQTIHTLDYFCYLAGGIERVKANMCNYSLKNVIEVEDTLTAYIKLKNGGTGIFMVTNTYAENSAPLFEICFEKGNVRYMDNDLYINGEKITASESSKAAKSYWGDSHGILINQFYKENKFFGVDDVADTMKAVFAIYESAKNGGVEIKL